VRAPPATPTLVRDKTKAGPRQQKRRPEGQLSFPKIRSGLKLLHLQDSVDSLPTMNAAPASLVSTLVVAFRSRLALQAEILALRHQLNVLRRSAGARSRLRTSDRVLWVWLSRLRSDWRSALVIVKPETVIVVPTIDFKLMFVFLVLAHERRRVLHSTRLPVSNAARVELSGWSATSVYLFDAHRRIDVRPTEVLPFKKQGSLRSFRKRI